MNRRIEVTEFQREIKRKKRVIEYAEKNGNIKTAVSPLESELVEQYIGDRPVRRVAFARQPTGYIVK